MTINTKYTLGDKFWEMGDNQAMEMEIHRIEICVDNSSEVTAPRFKISYVGRASNGYVLDRDETQIKYLTKQSLIASL